MKAIQKVIIKSRLKNKPANVSAMAWANAINWNIEAWKCVLAGQRWVHGFEICCPEQYEMLVDKKGRFILANAPQVVFSDTTANRDWAGKLEQQIRDMRARNEWEESLVWSRLLDKIRESFPEVINPKPHYPTKRVVKGHSLIRIKVAA